MTRDCDLVMKGGITSGVVYPLAAVELSRAFRFRQVGGTSAGAIAAAATAAAQYGKENGGTSFEPGLSELPGFLGQNLSSLFQPSTDAKPLFETLLAVTQAETKKAKIWAGVKTVASRFRTAVLAGAIVAGAPFLAVTVSTGRWYMLIIGALLTAVLAFLGAIAGLVLALQRRLRRALAAEKYFGLCTGYGDDEAAEPPPLTTWLANKLDALAGKDDPAEPLTFKDLWGDEEPPPAQREINLEVVTTCLTQGRPYRLPMKSADSHLFWFSPAEFRELFPRRIVDWMEAHPHVSSSGQGYDGLVPLPEPGDLPVVVAARMSLSFPLLISAIPLHAIDYGREDVRPEERRPERCWFSDGGITSNFPVHFFDSPVPRWPTFAINLRPFGRDWRQDPDDESENIRMARDNGDARLAYWSRLPKAGGFAQIFRFLGLIMDTSRNWMDNAQARVPGYRDRIVQIAHSDKEGGMNLAMSAPVITRLSHRGELAGKRLRNRFVVPPQGDESNTELTWDNQRWIRYRTFVALLEDAALRFRLADTEPQDGDSSFVTLIPDPPSYEWAGHAQRDFAENATNDVLDLAKGWKEANDRKDRHENLADGAPKPEPELRVSPSE